MLTISEADAVINQGKINEVQGLRGPRILQTFYSKTFHLAKQGRYSDEQMAAAAFSLAGKVMAPVPATITGLARASIFSSRFDDELKKHCAYPK